MHHGQIFGLIVRRWRCFLSLWHRPQPNADATQELEERESKYKVRGYECEEIEVTLEVVDLDQE